ncbi:MAG: serine protease, partial [Sphingobacteriales bacterium]
KWTGENRGLKKLKAVETKQKKEEQFQAWANSNNNRKAEYGTVLTDLKTQYNKLEGISLAREYINEAAFAIELVRFANSFQALTDLYKGPEAPKKEDVDNIVNRLKSASERHFKDYNKPTDKKVFEAMIPQYYNNIPKELHPAIFASLQKKYKGNWNKYTNDVYSKSVLADQEKVNALLNNVSAKSVKALSEDPALQLARSFVDLYRDKINPTYIAANDQINLLQRTYVAGLRAMQPDKKFYPDANSTMRVAYGKVDTYEPVDGVIYEYQTTMQGIMEKAATGLEDYKVPAKLVELYNQKDFGDYGVNGTMPVNFIASNHTTGGNSGSPVINANGELIGTNFDRNWEGTMSDIMYDPELCRNISVDIRYTLFIIDKFAGAGHLIKEMTLIRPETSSAKQK